MRCPSCHLANNTAVLCIRHRADGSVRRRHICLACRIRWTALEDVVLGSIRAAPPPAGLKPASTVRAEG